MCIPAQAPRLRLQLLFPRLVGAAAVANCRVAAAAAAAVAAAVVESAVAAVAAVAVVVVEVA
jgi:hypothetical protein